MLIYEKQEHLYGTEGAIPSDEDLQIVYKKNREETIELTKYSQLKDNKHGGITLNNDEITAWLGEKQIIPMKENGSGPSDESELVSLIFDPNTAVEYGGGIFRVSDYFDINILQNQIVMEGMTITWEEDSLIGELVSQQIQKHYSGVKLFDYFVNFEAVVADDKFLEAWTEENGFPFKLFMYDYDSEVWSMYLGSDGAAVIGVKNSGDVGGVYLDSGIYFMDGVTSATFKKAPQPE